MQPLHSAPPGFASTHSLLLSGQLPVCVQPGLKLPATLALCQHPPGALPLPLSPPLSAHTRLVNLKHSQSLYHGKDLRRFSVSHAAPTRFLSPAIHRAHALLRCAWSSRGMCAVDALQVKTAIPSVTCTSLQDLSAYTVRGVRDTGARRRKPCLGARCSHGLGLRSVGPGRRCCHTHAQGHDALNLMQQCTQTEHY